MCRDLQDRRGLPVRKAQPVRKEIRDRKEMRDRKACRGCRERRGRWAPSVFKDLLDLKVHPVHKETRGLQDHRAWPVRQGPLGHKVP